MRSIDIYLEAVETARQSTHDAARVGAVIYAGRKIAARSPNIGQLHAEVRCVRLQSRK